MSDPYEHQRAIAQSYREAEERNERASINEKLDQILALLATLAPKAKKE